MASRWRHSVFIISVGVALIGGLALGGCEDQSAWDHPNRQKNPAPPTHEQEERASVEQLEERWARQDALEERREERAERREAEQTAGTIVDLVADRLDEAVRVASEESERPSLRRDFPVGGGPPDDTDEADSQQ